MKHLARSSVHHTIKLKFVVVDRSESGGLLIFSDTAFEEVLFLLDIHHLGEPWERIFDTWIERFEAATLTTVAPTSMQATSDYKTVTTTLVALLWWWPVVQA